jgi:hypothetical protein
MNLPAYRSHKIVRAARIAAIEGEADGSATLSLDVPGEAVWPRVTVGSPWMAKHDPEVGGYYVVYEDGYASYSPAKAFEDGYTPIDPSLEGSAPFGFGLAIVALKSGKRVARAGWNGKGMWLALVPGSDYTFRSPEVQMLPHGTPLLPWVGMKTADGGFVPWLCSQTDALAEDWTIVP